MMEQIPPRACGQRTATDTVSVMGAKLAVTVRSLAAELGVAPITVSRALRGQGDVRPELATRIQSHAKKRGYRRDPVLSELMAGLGRAPGRRYRETVAFVWTHEQGQASDEEAGARSVAEELGYRMESIKPWHESLAPRDVSRILWARGIRGVLLAPNSSRPDPRYDLEWKRFAAVLVGSSLVNSGLTRVARDYYHDATLALDRLRAAGFRRVGLVLDSGIHHRTGRRYLAAHSVRAEPGDPPAFVVDSSVAPQTERERFERWLEAGRFDVLLSDSGPVRAWAPAGLPQARLALRPREQGTGVHADFGRVGAEAMRALDGLLRAQRMGLLEAPASVLVPGVWAGA